MSMLAGLPALVSLVVCIRWGTESAFLNVYLPTLLLLPYGCRMDFPGQMDFAESAMLPIAILHFWKIRKEWRSNFTDLLVLAFAAIVSISEYVNTDALLAKNVAIHLATGIVLPYLVGKALFVREDISREVAKRITILVTLVVILCLYEAKMTANPFTALVRPFFPYIDRYSVPTIRYHLVRIYGPWAHPILAGIILATAYRMARWLDWTGYWPRRVPFLGIKKVRLCEIVLIVGSAMTISRGPWIGAALAAVILIIVRSKRRLYASMLIVSLIGLVGGPIYTSFSSYINVKREVFNADNEAEMSAAYRQEMNDKYWAIVQERPTWGWGAVDGVGLYPIVEGMYSIDNHYLLVALDSGVYALGVMLILFFWMSVRLFGYALWPRTDQAQRLLAMTFGGIFVLYFVSLFTVYLGCQTQPLLFCMAGWSEALLAGNLPVEIMIGTPAKTSLYRLERVMV